MPDEPTNKEWAGARLKLHPKLTPQAAIGHQMTWNSFSNFSNQQGCLRTAVQSFGSFRTRDYILNTVTILSNLLGRASCQSFLLEHVGLRL